MLRTTRSAGALLCVAAVAAACSAADAERDADIDAQLTPATQAESRPGLAAAILIDVSGSMQDRVASEAGARVRKIEVARDAALRVLGQFAAYAREHPDETVLLGIYEFSRREDEPDLRALMPMAPPDIKAAVDAIARARADGGTPIGAAMVAAKRELDRANLERRHLLIVTDGENTDGVSPEQVAAAIARRPAAERPSMYFVAFDVEAARFAQVRERGVLVLAAADAGELNSTLESLLRGKILVE
jgi:Mg-chelatase subunit ChlD